MNSGLRIGQRQLNSEQMIAALVQYRMLETLIGQMRLDEEIQAIALSPTEIIEALVGPQFTPMPDDPLFDNFEGFLGQWCQAQQITPEYFQSVILRDLRIEKFKHLQFASQIESEFLRSQSDLDQVEYSLIQVDSEPLAQELYFKLRDDGADFAALAHQYSLPNSAQSLAVGAHDPGEWIGPVSLSSLPVAIARLFRKQQPIGQVHPPVPIADRFWIVRLNTFIAARLTAVTRTQILQRLYTQWLQAQIKVVMAQPGAIAVTGN